MIYEQAEIFVRHKLATEKQQAGETVDGYTHELKLLSKDCNFCQISASQHCDEATRDIFISGLLYGIIRQHLLKSKTLHLWIVFDQAQAPETT